MKVFFLYLFDRDVTMMRKWKNVISCCFKLSGWKKKIKIIYLTKKLNCYTECSLFADALEKFTSNQCTVPTLLGKKEWKCLVTSKGVFLWVLSGIFHSTQAFWYTSMSSSRHSQSHRDGKRPERNPLDEIETLGGWGNTTPAVYETRPLFVIDQKVLKL